MKIKCRLFVELNAYYVQELLQTKYESILYIKE